MNIAIDDSLKEIGMVCFQAALLYTSSRGERIGEKGVGGGEEDRTGWERSGEVGNGTRRKERENGVGRMNNGGREKGKRPKNGVLRKNNGRMKGGMEKEDVT